MRHLIENIKKIDSEALTNPDFEIENSRRMMEITNEFVVFQRKRSASGGSNASQLQMQMRSGYQTNSGPESSSNGRHSIPSN